VSGAGGTTGTGGASGTGGANGTGGASGKGGTSGASGTGGGAGFDAGAPIGFPYTPSNFTPTSHTPVVGTLLDCGVSTFDSQSLAFGNWCGRPTPTPVAVQSGGVDVVILPIVALTVQTGATLRLTGNRPVILAVYGDAVINGSIDGSANAGTPGAGGSQACGNSAGKDGTGSSSSGGGGGGGGGFATNGAPGGTGDGNAAGAAGVARGGATLVPLIGGCGGGKGGGCSSAAVGAGGGAVQLSAAGTLTVAGSVRANGGTGPNGCGSEGGGSGGGSGGGILLEGDRVTIGSGAQVTSNGGGGGRGGGGGNGGPGGTGSAAPQAGQSDGANGGGGGGGSVGRVRVNHRTSCTLGGTISPAASTTCP
jgi:hypothetical protein